MRLLRVLLTAGFAVSAYCQTVAPPSSQSGLPAGAPAKGEGTVLNAREYPGEDVGAQVNAAAATCVRGSVCHIVIPPSGRVALTTPIVMVDGEEVECSRSGYITDGQNDPVLQLEYSGNGVAVTMNGRGQTLRGCGLLLGQTAVAGVLMGGHSNYASEITVSGGGVTTTLVRVSGMASKRDTEDAHLDDSRLVNFVGTGVEIDHANDTFLTHVTAYGVAHNDTGRTLVIDSGASGTIINDFVGGNSGLHGLVVQNTLGGSGGGNAPTWIFANNFEADCSTGTGWLFDATLGSAMTGATFLNSWSSGAGACGKTVIPGVAGIEVAGGVNIHI